MSTDVIKDIRNLRTVELFKHIPNEILTELAAKIEVCHWEKNEVVFRKGDPGDSIYVIMGGWVKIATVNSKGEELVLNHCGPGQVVGEASLVDGDPRTSGVVALMPARALKLKREDFLELIYRNPPTALDMMRDLSATIRLSTVYIEKAIEWSQCVAEGDYSFTEEISQEHSTVVTMSRSDEARVSEFLMAFFRMVKGVREREEDLKQQVAALTIQIDEVKRQRDVDELTTSPFFKSLKSATDKMRKRRGGGEE